MNANTEVTIGQTALSAENESVFDWHFEASEGRSFNKIVFFNWYHH